MGARDIAYDVAIEGVESENFLQLLRGSSRLERLKDSPPPTLRALERRAENDARQFEVVLRSEGYYAGRAFFRIDRSESPTIVRFSINSGPRYELSSYEILYASDGAALPKTLPDAGVTSIAAARAPDILLAETRILERLAATGRPFARVVDRRVVVDHRTRTVAVTLALDAGPPSRFGPTTFEGLEAVRESYLRRLIPWREGEEFDSRKLDEYRRTLTDLDVFSGVEAARPEMPSDAPVPITVSVRETKMRAVGVGASYSSSEGAGFKAYWEHRNFFGRGERLRVLGEAAEIRQELGIDFRRPNFRRIDQNLLLSLKGRRQTTDAFDETSVAALAAVDRPIWNEKWILSLGAAAEWADIDDKGKRETFTLLSTPVSLRRNATDDLLNPTKGFRAVLRVTPYLSLEDGMDTFFAAEASLSAYRSFFDDRLTLAGRVKVGSIVGTSLEAVPKSKRFYSGGAGSVRGYDYQKVGPLDADEDPIGGRSVVELGAEARIRITDTIGLVPFVEGGVVAPNPRPNVADNFQWAIGIGAIYRTNFAPIRLDIAVPVDRRPGIDDHFEVYVSIGQSF